MNNNSSVQTNLVEKAQKVKNRWSYARFQENWSPNTAKVIEMILEIIDTKVEKGELGEFKLTAGKNFGYCICPDGMYTYEKKILSFDEIVDPKDTLFQVRIFFEHQEGYRVHYETETYFGDVVTLEL